MKFPSLILNQFCNSILETVEIESQEMNEDGGNDTYKYYNIKCNYQSKSKNIYTKEQKIVQTVGSCYIPGDPFIDIENLKGGKVILNGITYKIEQGTKARNLDGTINFTLLELI